MVKVKEVKQVSTNYSILLEDNETFDFTIVFDRDEHVLQGNEGKVGVGVRYSQAELTEILKIMIDLNKKLPRKKKAVSSKVCKKCPTQLSNKNKSGYCKKHWRKK